ncbi:uncharacterized protein LOC133783388 isoform X2 [Humulus lupulus]|uniref:uncharacterized protein LOC133783388 isoform X2 n=1 Tax=Humulus lupulus TaxID=3486 RepID=UPI002B4072F8|nr:uncharacterized protein LOC133783388 isoform X2 [Humulus lupulus]
MTISVGSIGFKTQFHVHCRAFLIPWVKNNSAITCLKSRDYNSSVPIRYIPKRFSNTNEIGSSEQIKKGAKNKEFCEFSEASIPFDNVVVSRNHSGNGNANGVQKRNNFDSKPRFEHHPMPSFKLLPNEFEQDNVVEEPEEVYEELFIDREKSSDQDNLPQTNRTKFDAEKMVVKLLAMRAFTAVELRKKLCGKKFSPEIVDEVINDYKCRGFINDSLYAEGFCQSRWSSSSWGPQRIKQLESLTQTAHGLVINGALHHVNTAGKTDSTHNKHRKRQTEKEVDVKESVILE